MQYHRYDTIAALMIPPLLFSSNVDFVSGSGGLVVERGQ